MRTRWRMRTGMRRKTMKEENIQVAFDSLAVGCAGEDVWGRGKADKY